MGLGLLVLAGCGPTILLSDGGTEAGTSTNDDSGPAGATESGVATSGVADTSMASDGPTPVTTATSIGDDDSDPDGDGDPDTSEGDDGPVGSGFIDDGFDDGPGPPECSPWEQECPDGEKCMPWSADNSDQWNSTRCVPIAAAPDQPGDPCTVEGSAYSGIDSCDLRQMCWDVEDRSNAGFCASLCGGTAENPICDDPETSCVPVSEVHSMCLLACDPLLQECDASDTCVAIGDSFVCTPLADDPAAGDSECESYDACAVGLTCTDDATAGCDGAGCCAAFCDLTLGDEMCPGFVFGEHCEPYFEEGKVIGEQNVGLCVL